MGEAIGAGFTKGWVGRVDKHTSSPGPTLIAQPQRSLWPPTDHSGGDGDLPSRGEERVAELGILKPPQRANRRRKESVHT